MKHGKRPSRAQKDKLKRLGLGPRVWLISKDCPSCFEVVHRVSGEVRRLGGSINA